MSGPIVALGAGICVAALIVHVCFDWRLVVGVSMCDTLRPGEVIVSTKLYRLVGGLRVGDIVVVRFGRGWLVKRIAWRSPGGKPDALWSGRMIGVEGDNRQMSMGSRTIGELSEKAVLARVFAVAWPRRNMRWVR